MDFPELSDLDYWQMVDRWRELGREISKDTAHMRENGQGRPGCDRRLAEFRFLRKKLDRYAR